jgi:hypothetical protein
METRKTYRWVTRDYEKPLETKKPRLTLLFSLYAGSLELYQVSGF